MMMCPSRAALVVLLILLVGHAGPDIFAAADGRDPVAGLATQVELLSEKLRLMSEQVHQNIDEGGGVLRPSGSGDNHNIGGGGGSDVATFAVLMQTGSVGSSWIAHLLDSHPNIQCHGEGFQGSSFDRIRNFLDNGDGHTVKGFKIKLEAVQGLIKDAHRFYHQDRLPEFLSMLRTRDTKIICLYRRNSVKHALSEVRHKVQHNICHTWETTDTPRGKECLLMVQKTPLPFNDFFRSKIERMQRTLADMDRVCMDESLHFDSAGQLRVWRVAYEDLAYDQHVTSGKDLLDALQRWLGVEPSTLHSNVMKMTPPRLRDTVVNFDELVSDFGAYFGENSLELKQLLEE